MDKVKDFLLSLLTWIGESPFRLFTVVLLCVLGLAGWIVYSEKDAFMASYRAQQALPHMNGKYEETTNFIMKNTTAEMVAIF
jgi:predicted negative regulator of RcsB-dependent stress response